MGWKLAFLGIRSKRTLIQFGLQLENIEKPTKNNVYINIKSPVGSHGNV